MNEGHTDVLNTRSAGVELPQPRAASRSMSDPAAWSNEISGPYGTDKGLDGSDTPSRATLTPRRGPGRAGGLMPSDDELLERTLAFSGSYVSDDGNVTIRRVAAQSFEYSGSRFLGNCTVCSHALLMPPTGEPLSDVAAVILFVAAHDHGDVD
jgi:hypothetical protein